jgi:hypothetical protein
MIDSSFFVCPVCGGRRVVWGEFAVHPQAYGVSGFQPEALRRRWFGRPHRPIPITSQARICLDCGLLWASVDQHYATKALRATGDEDLKEFLGLNEPKKASEVVDSLD